MTTIPTVAIWNQVQDIALVSDEGEEGEDIWQGMKNVGEDNEET
jgi:ribosome biogenesis protein NSA1